MMNRRNVTALLALVGLAVLSAGLLQAGEEAKATLDVKLSVRGMSCGGCVNAVKAALEKVKGVTKADVSLEKNEAVVTYDSGKTNPDELIKAVEKAGFKASVQKDEEKKG
jgi:mercuric transport protein